MKPSFELFDHTADIGVRVRAPTREGLPAPAAAGLYAVIGELAATGPGEPRTWTLTGRDAASLLRDWLTELLLLFEASQHIVEDVTVVEFGDTRLSVRGSVCPVDEDRTVYFREVKAVTYHELAVRETDGGYEAVFIVDI